MDLLPELIIYVSRFLPISDKRNYLMVCKNILKYQKEIMVDVVYHLSYICYGSGCKYVHADSFNCLKDVKNRVREIYNVYGTIDEPIANFITKEDNYTIICYKKEENNHGGNFGFVVEETYVDEQNNTNKILDEVMH